MSEHSDAWRRRMAAFLGHCRASAASEQTERLREALCIRQMRELDSGCPVVPAHDVKFEHLLEQSAFECAALEVLGPRAEFELSCDKERELSARVRLPGQPRFSSAEGRTIALALLAAWASAHLADTPRMLVTAEARNSAQM
jgi:hypothetical protein